MLSLTLSFPFWGKFLCWFLYIGVFFTVASADFRPTTVKDQVMVKQVYRVFNTKDWMCCLLECNGDSQCSSYNFEYDAEPYSGHICELSKCAMNEKREKGLIARRGFLFQQLKPSKDKDLCKSQQKPQKPQKEKPETFNGLESSEILQSRNDSMYFKVLLKYLGQKRRTWKRCYGASGAYVHAGDHSFNATAFHELCDARGPTVTIVRVDQYVFGGYIGVSWRSINKYENVLANETFLFSLYNGRGFKPHKFSVRPNKVAEMCHWRTVGPCFGKSDLILNPKGSHTMPHDYDKPPDCEYEEYCAFYSGKDLFRPDALEVFYEVN